MNERLYRRAFAAAIVAACVVALLLLIAVRSQYRSYRNFFFSIEDFLTQNMYNYATSRSDELIPIQMTAHGGQTKLLIPKAYLTITSTWQGGPQRDVRVEAKFYSNPELTLPDVAPPPSPLRYPDYRVSISISRGGESGTRELWERYIFPNLELIGESNTFWEFKYKKVKSGNAFVQVDESDLFLPKSPTENFTFLDCYRNPAGKLLSCTARTYLSDGLSPDYIFDADKMEEWREIDRRVRLLIGSFIVKP